eukprot:TRINITY_DN17182_c1_g2_i1.p3 TRINITY_DN17182_c1_g2~~TRINITY_DN17182_c1_g2_i1.p3  ORF type:complete len:129 (+),score=10.23 TRINITY_DN17182_c1_g2_i1:181-567(+)
MLHRDRHRLLGLLMLGIVKLHTIQVPIPRELVTSLRWSGLKVQDLGVLQEYAVVVDHSVVVLGHWQFVGIIRVVMLEEHLGTMSIPDVGDPYLFQQILFIALCVILVLYHQYLKNEGAFAGQCYGIFS